MGIATCTLAEFQKIIFDLSLKYVCGEYNIFSNNCNHFTNELVETVCGKSMPT